MLEAKNSDEKMAAVASDAPKSAELSEKERSELPESTQLNGEVETIPGKNIPFLAEIVSPESRKPDNPKYAEALQSSENMPLPSECINSETLSAAENISACSPSEIFCKISSDSSASVLCKSEINLSSKSPDIENSSGIESVDEVGSPKNVVEDDSSGAEQLAKKTTNIQKSESFSGEDEFKVSESDTVESVSVPKSRTPGQNNVVPETNIVEKIIIPHCESLSTGNVESCEQAERNDPEPTTALESIRKVECKSDNTDVTGEMDCNKAVQDLITSHRETSSPELIPLDEPLIPSAEEGPSAKYPPTLSAKEKEESGSKLDNQPCTASIIVEKLPLEKGNLNLSLVAEKSTDGEVPKTTEKKSGSTEKPGKSVNDQQDLPVAERETFENDSVQVPSTSEECAHDVSSIPDVTSNQSIITDQTTENLEKGNSANKFEIIESKPPKDLAESEENYSKFSTQSDPPNVASDTATQEDLTIDISKSISEAVTSQDPKSESCNEVSKCKDAGIIAKNLIEPQIPLKSVFEVESSVATPEDFPEPDSISIPEAVGVVDSENCAEIPNKSVEFSNVEFTETTDSATSSEKSDILNKTYEKSFTATSSRKMESQNPETILKESNVSNSEDTELRSKIHDLDKMNSLDFKNSEEKIQEATEILEPSSVECIAKVHTLEDDIPCEKTEDSKTNDDNKTDKEGALCITDCKTVEVKNPEEEKQLETPPVTEEITKQNAEDNIIDSEVMEKDYENEESEMEDSKTNDDIKTDKEGALCITDCKIVGVKNSKEEKQLATPPVTEEITKQNAEDNVIDDEVMEKDCENEESEMVQSDDESFGADELTNDSEYSNSGAIESTLTQTDSGPMEIQKLSPEQLKEIIGGDVSEVRSESEESQDVVKNLASEFDEVRNFESVKEITTSSLKIKITTNTGLKTKFESSMALQGHTSATVSRSCSIDSESTSQSIDNATSESDRTPSAAVSRSSSIESEASILYSDKGIKTPASISRTNSTSSDSSVSSELSRLKSSGVDASLLPHPEYKNKIKVDLRNNQIISHEAGKFPMKITTEASCPAKIFMKSATKPEPGSSKRRAIEPITTDCKVILKSIDTDSKESMTPKRGRRKATMDGDDSIDGQSFPDKLVPKRGRPKKVAEMEPQVKLSKLTTEIINAGEGGSALRSCGNENSDILNKEPDAVVDLEANYKVPNELMDGSFVDETPVKSPFVSLLTTDSDATPGSGEPIKRKRGRPRKIKVEDGNLSTLQGTPVKGKRGRKPKINLDDPNDPRAVVERERLAEQARLRQEAAEKKRQEEEERKQREEEERKQREEEERIRREVEEKKRLEEEERLKEEALKKKEEEKARKYEEKKKRYAEKYKEFVRKREAKREKLKRRNEIRKQQMREARERQLAEKEERERRRAEAPELFEEETQMGDEDLLKKGRMEVIDLESNRDFSVAQVAEYQWPLQGGEWYMIQEQVTQYLGVKAAFKRRYPNLESRPVQAEEKTFLLDSGLVSNTIANLGLTAVKSTDILDIMFADFKHKYDEFSNHLREMQAKEMSLRQLALMSRPTSDQIVSMERAVRSAAKWNKDFNKVRKRCSFDLQSYTVQYPQTKRAKLTRPTNKIGSYPIAVLPGQYTDHYNSYTPDDLRYLPLNTVLFGPLKPYEMPPPAPAPTAISQDSSDDSSSDESSESSSDDSASSVGEIKELPMDEDTNLSTCSTFSKEKSRFNIPETSIILHRTDFSNLPSTSKLINVPPVQIPQHGLTEE